MFWQASFYYGLSVLLWLAAGGVEVYAAIEFKNYVTINLGDLAIKNIFTGDQYEELFRRRAAAAVCDLHNFFRSLQIFASNNRT